MQTLNECELVAVQIVSGYAEPELASIGENLKRLRGGEDQKVVAQRMGIPQARLSNWEKDRYRTVSVRTLLWLAKGYRCGVEQLVQGLDAEYDASRDLLGQGSLVQRSATHPPVAERDADVPASARERIAKLQQELAAYKARLKETEAVAARLVHIAAGSKARKATGTTPGPRRRR